LDECNEICYKDPVLKDRQWTAYIDRSPGSASYSEVYCLSTCSIFYLFSHFLSLFHMEISDRFDCYLIYIKEDLTWSYLAGQSFNFVSSQSTGVVQASKFYLNFKLKIFIFNEFLLEVWKFCLHIHLTCCFDLSARKKKWLLYYRGGYEFFECRNWQVYCCQ
jgi:hypothetical protein